MGRWIAIGSAPGWENLDRLTAELKATEQWRVDPRTTITSVTALANGKMIAECHASTQAEFEGWLQKKGWTVESITPITAVAKAGDIYKVK